MNMVAAIIGRRRPLTEETVTADVVPVAATTPDGRAARRFRGQIRKKKRNALVASVLGRMSESDGADTQGNTTDFDQSIFPDNAEEVDGTDLQSGPSMKGVKDYQEEPTEQPTAQSDEEDLLTPEAALVAPDVTPMAYAASNPTRVPGVQAQSFTTQQANAEQEPGSAMDVMLGNSDKPVQPGQSSIVPPANVAPSHSVPAPTIESAYSKLRIQSPASLNAQESVNSSFVAQAALVPGAGMPDPQLPQQQGRRIMEVMHKFVPRM